MYSLRKICYFAFFAVALMLAVVIVFSVGQYRLSAQYKQIIKQSEEAVFEFNAIREQMIESLIKKDFQNVTIIAAKLNKLNSILVGLQESDLIPAQYKLDMANRVDLTEMVIVAGNLQNNKDTTKSSLFLQSRMRSLAEYLMRFDRVIVSQMKAKVVHFQAIVIGILGVVLSLITFSLLLLYRRTIVPLNHLVDQVKNKSVLKGEITDVSHGVREIVELRDAMNTLMNSQRLNGENGNATAVQEPDDRFAGVMNAITNLLNGIINYAQLLADLCEKNTERNEERKMILNIISYAERISVILSKS